MFVCSSCKKDIDKDEMPRKSLKSSFIFANFPNDLIQKLKRRCKIKENKVSRYFNEPETIYERKALNLNKLESFLLKLVIPFIRIAHCPRGPYFKVKGDLILISSDIQSSMSKILPLEQSLIPVAFKRKLAYTGSYIEEFIEKEKVQIYFSWFKEHNHLFKDIELDSNKIEEFKTTSLEASSNFEKNTKNKSNESQNKGEDSDSVDLSDEEGNIFKSYDIETHEPIENFRNQDNSSMFFNKYCEDTTLPSVANRFASVVVNYNINRNKQINETEDFDIEDEIDKEIIKEVYYSSEEDEEFRNEENQAKKQKKTMKRDYIHDLDGGRLKNRSLQDEEIYYSSEDEEEFERNSEDSLIEYSFHEEESIQENETEISYKSIPEEEENQRNSYQSLKNETYYENIPIQEQEMEKEYKSLSEEEKEMDFSENSSLNSDNVVQGSDSSNDIEFDVKDEFLNNTDKLLNPTEDEARKISETAKEQADRVVKKMEKVAVAPGELGNFKNWGSDIFLEEKCFPSLFPYGTGGYLSSSIDDPKSDMGFSNYCIQRIMSSDPKYRNDATYLFFLLLVKELIMLKQCKSTYLRQATRLPHLAKKDVLSFEKEDLKRFNRTFEVFKNMRGTSMYYQESKKNLMALLRQNGCPSLFYTISCAEFDWSGLLKEIIETVYRKKISYEEVSKLSSDQKNKLIKENYVQSTLHFQKRIEKMFALMKYNNFFGDNSNQKYHVSSYFYRIEFQARGAPHVHSLLWLKDEEDKDAPSFWNEEVIPQNEMNFDLIERRKKIENFCDAIISTSPDEMVCEFHERNSVDERSVCKDCEYFREMVSKYQKHKHTSTCSKKKKNITIKSNEGHGIDFGPVSKIELQNIPICRFQYPRFPMDETRLILGVSNDMDDVVLRKRKEDLNKIMKFLLRQTFDMNSESWKKLQNLDFIKFIYHVGMFKETKPVNEYSEEEIFEAKERYIEAISMTVKGTGKIFLKRKVKDIFTNGYNKKIMRLHQANHDLQLVIDQFACAQYVCGYLTKNEAGISKLLKAVNDECDGNIRQLEKLNKLAAVLDKHREVSVQEAVYRLLSLPMTKSSVKVKYLSSIHPHFRDGLLKGNIEELAETDSVFHNSPHQYFESRPLESNEKNVKYTDAEKEPGYWDEMSLADFWADYEIVYDKKAKSNDKENTVQTLQNEKGFIRKRKEPAVLRYYLPYDNDDDLARGLLILFLPFRDEMKEIHEKDVKELLDVKKDLINLKRSRFEKYQVMNDLINLIQKESEKNDGVDLEEEDCIEEETTSAKDIDEFNKWAKQQALKELSKFKNLTELRNVVTLRRQISELNGQQRKLFDDICERIISTDIDEPPFYLFIAGEAGTGKSHLVCLLIEAIKIMKINPGDEIKKPPVLTMAPTGNSAFIIGGRTIDSALGFVPNEKDRYVPTGSGRMASMKYQYEDVGVLFIDEISMVGSMKLTKINFRLQDLAEGENKLKFMGGKSLISSGNMFPL